MAFSSRGLIQRWVRISEGMMGFFGGKRSLPADEEETLLKLVGGCVFR